MNEMVLITEHRNGNLQQSSKSFAHRLAKRKKLFLDDDLDDNLDDDSHRRHTMNKTAIKNLAVWARRKLISEVTYKAGLMGISESGILSPLSNSTDNIEFYDIGTGKPTELSGIEVKQRKALVSHIKEKESSSDYKTAFQFVLEEVAYTWFNRLVAIRFMEVNEYLPSGVRVLSSELKGKAEPDMVTTPFETDMVFSAYETDKIVQLKDENKLDELFRMLFIKQCNKLNEVLPQLFEKTSDYTELLLNIAFTDKDGIVSHIVNDIAENDFKEAVEIIGWLYQYYNTEPKDEVFAQLKKNVKITKEHIPAATQLFTPDWIVRYMVENSLGRLWIEGHNEGSLKDKWKYYLDEAQQEGEVQVQLDIIREEYKNLKPEDIKCIDPCMGSGHILVYAFDVLLQIYESQGYTQRDAASTIIENNICGLDIDERAYQLAYFALMMKARQYDRRFLTRGIAPQVFCPKGYAEGQEFGSLLNVDALEPKPQEPVEIDLFNINWEKDVNTWNFRRLLNQKYDIVVTNPPYMWGSGMNERLANYVKINYPDSKWDLFAVFIERCLQMAKKDAYTAMITQHAFMFLSSYEKLRAKLLHTDFVNMAHLGARAFEEISGERVQTTSLVLCKRNVKGYKATFARLVDYNSQQAKENAFLAKNDLHIAQQEKFSKIPQSPIAYWVSEKMLEWYSDKHLLLKDFALPRAGLATGDNSVFQRLWYEVNYKNIGFNFADTTETVTSHYKWYPCNSGGEFRKWSTNDEYVVNWNKDGFELKNFKNSNGKIASRAQNTQFYFKKGITWNKLSSSRFAVKFKRCGYIYDDTSRSAFIDNESELCYLTGLLCSNVAFEYLKALNPTMSFTNGDLERVPYIYSTTNKPQIDEFVQQNISLSRTDWDSFETSWDFVRHPLLKYGVSFASGLGDLNDGKHPSAINMRADTTNGNLKLYEKNAPINYTIHSAFEIWKELCEKQFNQLKANEEELNRIFIDIYGLQDELTPEVADKDVTVHYICDNKATASDSMQKSSYLLTKQDVVKSLISYAVGCMLGRYSLYNDGLLYAGGGSGDGGTLVEKIQDILKSKGLSMFPENGYYPDMDNCIPITDEEYFEDDMVGLFVAFVKKVYGAETLEENLDFIAKALGNKGDSSRDIIRNYFVKDFYKDHVKTYQKRPIYWMYDSGKQDGFKALIYMHRYNADTTGKVRVEYLHKMQKTYTNEIARMQDEIENGKTPADIAKAEKRKEKLVKQLKDTRDYDEKIAHLALSRIAIDLDDGVKVNYEKVQTAQDGKVLDILGKI